jgi:hypothetical protein
MVKNKILIRKHIKTNFKIYKNVIKINLKMLEYVIIISYRNC